MRPHNRQRNGLQTIPFVGFHVLASILSFVVMVAVSGQAGWAKDSETSNPITVRKTEDGLHFQVPADWPIEKRGGVTAPIPIEEYLSRKFKGVETQVQALEQRINGLDVRQRAVEETIKQERQARRAADEASSAPQ